MDQSPQTQALPPEPSQVSVQPARKNGWLIGGIIAGALVLLGGLGWWLAVSAQDAYVKGAETYEANLKQAFLFYKNSTDTQNHVDEIKAQFNTALDSKPNEPTLLGFALGVPTATKDRLNKITTPFAAMRDAFVDYHAFNTFAENALILLDTMAQAGPLLDIHANEAVYNKAAADLRGLAGPSGVTDFKNKKADALAAIATEVGKAEAAIAKIDTAGYKAAEANIATLLKQISTDNAGQELQEIYRIYYGDLSDTYDKAAKALGVEG